MSEVRLELDTVEGFFDDARALARRLDAGDRQPRTASIGFEGMDTLLSVLTANRWRLLKALRRHGPSSIRRLAADLQRDYRGVHADVSTLLQYGLIARRDDRLIEVPWSKITAEMAFDSAA